MQFSNPREAVLQFSLREGMRVADMGTGSGHYAHAAAGIVGERGRVYAIDIQEDVLKHVREGAHPRILGSLETIWGDFERVGGTRLRDGVLDAAILANTLFQLEDHQGAAAEIRRVLKPQGRLLVVDWAGPYDGMGPSAESVYAEHAAEELFIGSGFHKEKAFRAGPHHYALVFTTP